MKKILNSLFILVAIFSQFSCTSNTTEPKKIDNYMSLSVGDIREYYDAKMEYYQTWEIIGKTKRTDSTEVFLGEWSNSIDTTNQSRQSYYAIIGNYFVSTELEKSDNSENPYHEQRLAEIKPKDGDRWAHTLGVPDSEKIYFTAKFVGKYKTTASEFMDVYGYTLTNVLTTYYANNFGHVGSSILSDSTFDVNINYAKINGREIGDFIPYTLSKRIAKSNNKKIRKVNFLGQLIN